MEEALADVVNENKKHEILSVAWSPLGSGKIFEIDELSKIAERYNKTVDQVVLRWSLQHGFVPLPKTATFSRIEENADIFDFDLSDEDMKKIDSFKGQAGRMWNPDEIDF